ncbi:MAG: VCBS repeat-containing protein [Fuerstiella sp.]|nr:VCBS repeat-containing protein [Fuerstiella sp.]MCP4857868.1 VCBS repeat-containing protein [Fuerstiella sp.]
MSRSIFHRVVIRFALIGACCSSSDFSGLVGGEVQFERHRVGTFRSETCGVGDFNNDGKTDIVAGPYLYLAPDWKPRKIRELEGEVDEEGRGYYWDFMNAPLDVDGDGLLDVISCSWHGKKSEWYRNIGDATGLWPCTIVEENGHFEHGELWDVDGDGKALEVVPSVTGTIWYELAKTGSSKQQLIKHVISEKTLAWGCGVGDVNGDGRPDMLRPDAWFEAPADPRKGTWKEHPLAIGHIEEGKSDHTPQIFTQDINGDGLNDIVTSSAHKLGIFWYQQISSGSTITWKQHIIDATWTQAHSLAMADLDGDGDNDLITGKRFFAHDGRDPDGNGTLGLYWYEFKQDQAQRDLSRVWERHVISFDEGIGSGMNIPIVDLDHDGDLDFVVTGKWGGPVWFENKTR